MSARSRPNPIRALNPISDDDAARMASLQTLVDLAEAIVATPAPPLRTRPRGRVTSRADHPRRARSTRRARRWFLPVPLLAAAVAALIVVLTAGGSGTSLVSRAYAAISPTGVIVHYLESMTLSDRTGDRPTIVFHSTSEVWTSGSRTHMVSTLGGPSSGLSHFRLRTVRLDRTIDGDQITTYVRGRVMHARYANCGQAPGNVLGLAVDNCEPNPIAGVRAAYRSGRLHAAGQTMLGGRRLDVLTGHMQYRNHVETSVRLLIDPGTFIPVEFQTTSNGRLPRLPGLPLQLVGQSFHDVETVAFTHYQRLALTPHNRRLLALHPHRSPAT
jgi:hypothetical protein